MAQNLKDTVFSYLTKNFEFKQVSENRVEHVANIPGRQIIINGQPIEEQPLQVVIPIEYLGEGSFYNVGEEEQAIYGFNMKDDIWVENFDDFKYWFDLFFGKILHK